MPQEVDSAWIERVVESYSDMLLRVALQQMKNQSDAEDAVQTVFLKLLRTRPSFESREHEKAWLIRVCINACHDMQRSLTRKRTEPLAEGVHAAATTNRAQLEVMEAVNKLDEKYALVILLYYYEGYTTAEIAGLLDTAKGTVDSRLFRAREKLNETLEGGWD